MFHPFNIRTTVRWAIAVQQSRLDDMQYLGQVLVLTVVCTLGSSYNNDFCEWLIICK